MCVLEQSESTFLIQKNTNLDILIRITDTVIFLCKKHCGFIA